MIGATGMGMMARRGVLGWMAGGAALMLALVGCGARESASYRFRMTVEVDTPEGVRSGSSVYEITARNEAGLDPSGEVRRWRVRGEAVAVDLPGGETLFALLKTGAIHGDLAGMSMTALDPVFKNDIVESTARIAVGDGIRSPAEVAPADYPMLVTFRDIADPRSVARLDPADLAATFGAGVQLRRIAVEVTDDPVTTGIEKRLDWLPELNGDQFPRKTRDAVGPPLGLQGVHLSTESHK